MFIGMMVFVGGVGIGIVGEMRQGWKLLWEWIKVRVGEGSGSAVFIFV